jgi:hypothetical protein
MPSKSRPVYRPPADFNSRDILLTEIESSEWFRLHPGNFDPIRFSKSDESRFSPSGGPCGALYLGADPETCILEKFGDIIYGYRQRGKQVVLADAVWRSRELTQLVLPGIKVCDLTNATTLQQCGVDASALMLPDLAVPQAWGVALMNHPNNFDGILYLSRFTQAHCLAIFDRAPRIEQPRRLGLLANHEGGAQVLKRFEIALV